MLAGGFKRKTLNKRDTTAVASASPAREVRGPRSCQRAKINSRAIQIVADEANQEVTGCPTTTLKPHPVIMTATASVARLSQRTYSSRPIVTLLKSETSLLCRCTDQSHAPSKGYANARLPNPAAQ